MNVVQRVIHRAIEIQQIPAPTFGEHQRAQYIFDCFKNEGLSQVEIDDLGNVYACLPGKSSDRSLVVSAHTDTVFPIETDLNITQDVANVYGPGIGDNSVGVAGLFGLIWELRHRKVNLPGDLWLVANVAEEGLGDLAGMKQVVDRFGKTPIGYVILEGLAYGRLYHRGLGVRRYQISVETSGGHSWVDYGNPSAIHELSFIISQILGFRLPNRTRTTVNVGKISGGMSINTIAPYAVLELDLRSENQGALSSLCQKVEELIRFSERPGVHLEIKVIGDRPYGEISVDHPLVQLAVRTLAAQGSSADLLIGSTDANVPLSRGIPSICIGLTNGGGAHTVGEFMNTGLLAKGLAQLAEVTIGAFDLKL